MRTRDGLERLLIVVDAAYRRELSQMQDALDREARDRSALGHLDQLAAAAGRDLVSANDLKAVGADMVWQEWVGRKRADLNAALARSRAERLEITDRTRRALARKLALSSILDDVGNGEARSRVKVAQTRMDALSALVRRQRN